MNIKPILILFTTFLLAPMAALLAADAPKPKHCIIIFTSDNGGFYNATSNAPRGD